MSVHACSFPIRRAFFLGAFLLSIAHPWVPSIAQSAAATNSALPVSDSIPQPSAAPQAQPFANPHSTNLALLAERRMIDITKGQQTLIGFFNPPPYPRPRGNTFFLFTHEAPGPDRPGRSENIRIININAENLSEIARRLKTKNLEMAIIPYTNSQSIRIEVQNLDEVQTANAPPKISEYPTLNISAYGIVIDSRIPRDWFQEDPIPHHRLGAKTSRQLKEAFPGFFRATTNTPPPRHP